MLRGLGKELHNSILDSTTYIFIPSTKWIVSVRILSIAKNSSSLKGEKTGREHFIGLYNLQILSLYERKLQEGRSLISLHFGIPQRDARAWYPKVLVADKLMGDPQ